MHSEWIINLATIVFFILWGTYERFSAIKTREKHHATKDNDNYSLLVFYVSIWLSAGIAFPVSFSEYGRISSHFPLMSILGFLTICLGLFIRLTAIKTLQDQFTYTVKIIDNHELITAGIYKYIRHPSYSGQSLIFLGMGIAVSNWLSILIFFIPTLLTTFYRISVEERVLLDHFGEQYSAYKRRSKMLIPYIL